VEEGQRVYHKNPSVPSAFTAEERLREVHPALRRHLGKRVAPPLPVPTAQVWQPAEPALKPEPVLATEQDPGTMPTLVCPDCGAEFKATRKAMAHGRNRGFALRCEACRTARFNERQRGRARRKEIE
jgi:hypothetical protein